MTHKLRRIVGWSLVGLLAVFVAVNFQRVEVNFLLVQVVMPKALLIAVSAALGAGAVYALRFIRDFRKPPGS